MSDPIMVGDEGPERELPKAGICNAVCCYVEDVGYQQTMFGEKRQIVIGFELNQRITQEGKFKGERFLISNTYTASLNEKANLHKHLVGWLGRALTPAETKQYDISGLRGKGVTVTILHRDSKDGTKTYANITALAPVMEGLEPMMVELKAVPDWVKEKKQQGTAGGLVPPTTATGGSDMGAVDEVPF